MVNSISNVGYPQAVNFSGVQYQPSAAPAEYVTNPYPNDTVTLSNKQESKSNKRAKNIIASAVVTAAACALARKFVPGLKNYTKITENATIKQKAANIVVTVGDKVLGAASKVADKAKGILTRKGTAKAASAAGEAASESVIKAASNKDVEKNLITLGRKKISPELEVFEATTHAISNAAKNGGKVVAPVAEDIAKAIK